MVSGGMTGTRRVARWRDREPWSSIEIVSVFSSRSPIKPRSSGCQLGSVNLEPVRANGHWRLEEGRGIQQYRFVVHRGNDRGDMGVGGVADDGRPHPRR